MAAAYRIAGKGKGALLICNKRNNLGLARSDQRLLHPLEFYHSRYFGHMMICQKAMQQGQISPLQNILDLLFYYPCVNVSFYQFISIKRPEYLSTPTN